MIKKVLKTLFGSIMKLGNGAQETKTSKTSKEPSLDLVYEGTPGIKKLLTKETPKQILTEDFPNHQWPISGGWGYSIEDAVVLELENSGEGVPFEYKFIEYRSYEEAIIFRPKGQQFAGFNFELDQQSLVQGPDGKNYDKLILNVTAYTEEDFEFLKNDWESHNGYDDDVTGKISHLQMAESKIIRYKVIGWFDISKFY